MISAPAPILLPDHYAKLLPPLAQFPSEFAALVAETSRPCALYANRIHDNTKCPFSLIKSAVRRPRRQTFASCNESDCPLKRALTHRERQPGRDQLLPEPLRWTVFAFSGLFLLLGAGFLLAPGPGAAFYGLETSSPSALFYVRAIGVRDAALALYLFGLAWAGLRRALMIVTLGTLIIPLGDILLLASSGSGKPGHYLLHAASLFCFAALAWWSRPART
jgi:hypothetical protein